MLAASTLCMAICACNVLPVGGLPAGSTSGADSPAGGAVPGSTPSVGATALEQLSLERLNRARLRPAAEAAANGIAIDEGIPGQIDASPKPAVALNAQLNQSARGHSQDMLARNYFEHDTPEGVSPFTRMNNAGYIFITAGENLAWRGTTGFLDEPSTAEAQHVDLFVDSTIPGRGHRKTMLNAAFREVGISVIRGRFTENGTVFDSLMQTQDFGTVPNSPTFVLGVVYTDHNGNGRYDFNEGVPGAAVTLGDVVKNTNAGGGYSFAISQPGAYTIKFPGNKSQALDVAAGNANIKVDLVSGSTIVVNLGLGDLN